MNTLLHVRSLLAALALTSVLAAPSAASAQSNCLKWDFDRPFIAEQTNGFRVRFSLSGPLPPDVAGTAAFCTRGESGPMGAFGACHTRRRVTGTVDGDSIEMHTDWGGVYTASVDHRGHLVGTTVDKANPAARSRANWISDRKMNCLLKRSPPGGSNDFNGDRNGDIVWHNASTNEAQIWFMEKSSRVARATIGDGTRPLLIGQPWRIVGSRDFSGDRKTDLLWHNASTGETQLWLMDGARRTDPVTVVDERGAPILVAAPWSIVGTGDFDLDGHPDIAWYNGASGAIQVWLMERHRIRLRPMLKAENGSLLSIESTRRIAGVQDMDNDGRPDLIVHNSAHGGTQVFRMNGLKVIDRPPVLDQFDRVMLVGLPWRITGADDFDRDGFGDILWHNGATGETQIWLMRGARIVDRRTVDAQRDGGGALVGLPWRIMNH